MNNKLIYALIIIIQALLNYSIKYKIENIDNFVSKIFN